ncbi:fasciclin domain-containing protein, partial [Flavobacteriales bacterium]|nr:fasciclin domain-containing protein [Flavobacteriales bacterium]
VSVITGNSFGNPESFASSPTTGPVLYTHVFTIAGSYSYDCSVGSHAQNGMVGSLTVNGPPPNTIYDIVSNSTDHTTLKVAVDACSLDGPLSGAGPFTLFAPTDAAFNALPSGTVPALLNDIPTLTNILLHHAVGDSVMSGMLFNGQIVTTLAGTDLTVTIDTSGVYIDGAQVTVADVVADNGVVHVINAVLLPVFGCMDATALNYDSTANIDNGSCLFPDCNGIAYGTSLLDSCGVCQQAYIYNFSTNIPTFLNDTTGVIVGPGESLIMPNDPSNPLWNASCSGCTDPAALNYDPTATIDNGTCTYSNSIYDIVSNSTDHTTLKVAVDACSLDGTLSVAGPFTLFAPTDAAFNALPSGTVLALLNDIPTLTNILLHHALGDSVMSSMLFNGQIVTTLAGTDVTVTIDTSGVYIDGAQVTVADIVADNGVVHVINAVLLPNPGCTDPTATNYDSTAIVDDGSCTYATNTIYDVVVTSLDHNLLEIAVDTCGLDGALSGSGPLTLFAPTDAAFNALPTGTVAALLNDLPTLTNILLHHVVGDSVMSGMLSNGQVVTTLLGTDVTVTINSSGVYIDNAMVTVVDIIADNGVVHVIDAVLLPNPGCTDPTATNYDSTAFVDDGSCLYATNSIYDVVVTSPDHNLLELAIDTCGLDGTLSAAGPFTLFAPTDAALNALGQATLLQLLADLPTLTNILKHHVVADSVMSGMLSNGQIVTTLLGDDVTVTINSTGIYIDNALVTVADIVADNGVVHVIDAVLIPTPVVGNSVYDIISASPAHTTLKLAIDTCGLAGTLKGAGPFTVFAPTDAAFNALPSGTIAALLNDLPQLTDILKHHVVGDSVMSGMLSNGQTVTTLLGDDVTVTINTSGVYIDNAMVTVVDIIADNGVVHVIDAVLLPSTTGINNINDSNVYEYMYSINLLGEKVNRSKRKQVVLDIYSNGKVVKRFNP